MPLLLVLILFHFNMSLSYTPAECPYFMSLQHVPISRPCNMSSFHIPVTGPHFRPCNMFLFEFMSLQHGSISYLCSMFPFYVHATVLSLFCAPATWPYPMTLEHVPISCPYNIVISHPCKISSFYLPATLPISRPSNVSLFHVPETFPYFTSLQHVPTLHPCNLVPFHFPCSMSLFHVLTTYLIPLEHVLISHPWDISLFHVTLRHVLISHPCDVSLFYTPATCPCFTFFQQVSILCPCNMYPFHAPALTVGTIVVFLFLLARWILLW